MALSQTNEQLLLCFIMLMVTRFGYSQDNIVDYLTTETTTETISSRSPPLTEGIYEKEDRIISPNDPDGIVLGDMILTRKQYQRIHQRTGVAFEQKRWLKDGYFPTVDDLVEDGVPSTCSLNISDDYTLLQSPNYPDLVPSGTWCLYGIFAPKNYVITVEFYDFNLEYSADSCSLALMMVIDFETELEDYKLWCGKLLPKKSLLYASISRGVMIYFEVSMDSKLTKGFSGVVRFYMTAETTTTTTTTSKTTVMKTNPLCYILVFASVLFLF